MHVLWLYVQHGTLWDGMVGVVGREACCSGWIGERDSPSVFRGKSRIGLEHTVTLGMDFSLVQKGESRRISVGDLEIASFFPPPSCVPASCVAVLLQWPPPPPPLVVFRPLSSSVGVWLPENGGKRKSKSQSLLLDMEGKGISLNETVGVGGGKGAQ